MSTVEHPLEMLYQARGALQDAVTTLRQQPPGQVSDDLGGYASVNTSILYEFRSLLHLLAEQIRDTNQPAVRGARGELREAVGILDLLIASVERHQPTIEALRNGAPSTLKIRQQNMHPADPVLEHDHLG